jgi:anti-anti-sigma factor
MTTNKFEANNRHRDGVVIIDLSGEIDSFADEALGKSYVQAEAEEPSAIVLNFEDVSYINSTGIALLVSLLAQARKAHREIRAFGLSDHYKEIFEITRLADFVHIVADEDSAVVRE